jgi:phosphoglucosamine mutase
LDSREIKRLFGTDGIRGEAGKFPLDPAAIRVIGESLARHMAARTGSRAPRIIVGRDTRESGPWIERELIGGARAAGAEVRSAGVITTPGVAFLTRDLPADAGVVISASHNPYQDNGIKIFEPSGRKIDDASERLIEADIATAMIGTTDVSKSAVAEDGLQPDELRSRYLDFLNQDVAQGLSLTGLTIVIDCANGASFEIAPQLFAQLGAGVIAINCHPNGRNINLDCGSLHIDGLQRRVIEERADIGVAFDGDADRALFVDSNGEFVDGDATLWVMAKNMKAGDELPDDTVIATVMSNVGLEVALRSLGIKLVRTDVGDKYVLEELLRSGASLGGEQSGHIIFPRLSLAGDGLITTLRLLGIMRQGNKSLSELTQGFRRFPQILVNVEVREKLPFDQISSLSGLARETASKLGDRGRLLLRYSGTEPLARVMIEGENQDEIDSYANALAEAIRDELGSRKA